MAAEAAAAQAQAERLARLQGMDAPAVCQALVACLSPDPTAREPAEALLRDAEGTPGFCTLLLQIATSGEAEAHLQKLAVLAAKNAIGRSWSQARDPRAPSIAEEEKTALRAAVIAAVCSTAVTGDVSLQLAMIAAKIARADFPRRWPTLLPALAEGLQSSEGVIVFHSVRCLHYVLKEQTSKRLMRDRLDFIDGVTPQLLAPLSQMWSTHSSAAIAAATPTAIGPMELVLSQFFDKCLLRLLCHGFRPGKLSPEDSPAGAAVLPALLEKTNALYAALSGGCVACSGPFHTLLKGWCKLQGTQPKALLVAAPDSSPILTSVLQLSLQVLSHGPTPPQDSTAERPALKATTPSAALRMVHLPTARLRRLNAGEEKTAAEAVLRSVCPPPPSSRPPT